MTESYCQIHSTKIEYLCLDTGCLQNRNACFLCVKEVHADCLDEYLIEVESIEELFEYGGLEEEVDRDIREKFLVASESNFKRIEDQIGVLRENLKFLEEGINVKTVLDPNFATLLKKYFKNFGNEDKFLYSTTNSKSIDMVYQKSLEEYRRKLFRELEEFDFNFNFNLTALNFRVHEHIIKKETVNGVFFERNLQQNSCRSPTAICLVPIRKKTRIRISKNLSNPIENFNNFGFFEYANVKSIDLSSSLESEDTISLSSIIARNEKSIKECVKTNLSDFVIELDSDAKQVTISDIGLKWTISANCSRTIQTFGFFLTLNSPNSQCIVCEL